MSIKQRLVTYSGLDLHPGMGDAELREFERGLPGKPDEEILELLEHTTGFKTSVIGAIDFTGRAFRFEFRDLVPHGLAIAKTIQGNFWILDITGSGAWGPVFLLSHDPPVMAKQFESIDLFVDAVVNARSIRDEAESLARKVWHDVASGISQQDATHSSDELVSKFASGLPPNFRVFDLRRRKLVGFAWGRGGPDLECKRYGAELLFAVEIPEPKRGLIGRLLGRR